MQKFLANRSFMLMTLSYVLALSIIAALSFWIHHQQDAIMKREALNGEIVKMAANQRTLSQRIAWFSERLADPSISGEAEEHLEEELGKAIDDMENSYNRLMSPEYIWKPDAPNRKLYEELYYGGDAPLDALIREYLEQARTIKTADDPTAALASLTLMAETTMLPKLERAIFLYTDNGFKRIRTIRDYMRAALYAILATLMLEAAFIFSPAAYRIYKQEEDLEKLARTDPLTGCHNRRSLFELASNLILLAQRQKDPLSAIIFDIDKFKKVNDTYGHAAGDEAIKHAVAAMHKIIRKSDIAARIGGEEFAIILPGTNEQDAALVAEKIRAEIMKDFVTAKDKSFKITASFGVTMWDESCGTGPDTLISKADQGLYKAKETGRNKVIRFSELSPEREPQAAKA